MKRQKQDKKLVSKLYRETEYLVREDVKMEWRRFIEDSFEPTTEVICAHLGDVVFRATVEGMKLLAKDYTPRQVEGEINRYNLSGFIAHKIFGNIAHASKRGNEFRKYIKRGD